MKKGEAKFKAAEVIAVLESCAGNQSLAARRLGCARNTVRAYVEKFPEIADALVEIKATFIDFAESQLQISCGKRTRRRSCSRCVA
jgi:hypothetical protein